MSARSPTRDDNQGMQRWNGLTPAQRAYWLQCANSARAVDAWYFYKHIRDIEKQLS